MYLVGSVHLLAKDYYPLNPALESAFKDSDRLVEEVDLGEMMATENQLNMLMQGMLPAGQSLETGRLQDHVRPGQQASRRTGDAGRALEADEAVAARHHAARWNGRKQASRPSSVSTNTSMIWRKRPENPWKDYETISLQIAQFDGMTNQEQERLLAETLDELDTQQAEVTKLADAWKAGDVATGGTDRVAVISSPTPGRTSACLSIETGTGCRRSRPSPPGVDARSSSSAPRTSSGATA